ncbi:MAG TPA: tetratricopeptide repeat protein [Anaerolineae bacterium]|nr:tetratricopeptide repeat protein [Anaerolineae bacterium]
METLNAYIPIDRQHALARGAALPDRTQGAALFADISGFTPLTEALTRELGPQRGAEELTRHLNNVYDALITELEHYGGSVIGFAGDGITCWFDANAERGLLNAERDGIAAERSAFRVQHSSFRATACALSMQRAMARFARVSIPSGSSVSLAMKAAVAAGAARRFLVGDPQLQIIDTLAGALLDNLAAAEHLAGRGEVVLDPATVAALGDRVQLAESRADETGQRFGVVSSLSDHVAPEPWPPLPPDALSEELLRPWLLPPVYERLHSGRGEFLAELRPAVALFLRFGGIDYDSDEAAGAKLHDFIQAVQRILKRYEASLLQLTIGDKGSFLYAAFGAPVAHEDDAVRAASAALELRALAPALDFISHIQIGISQGRLRTGAYGGAMRRTYGVLGDDVNLAARLMQAAAPGQILVGKATYHSTGDVFSWESLPDIRVKGKAEPVAVFDLVGVKERRAVRLQEPDYALPMVGRTAELALVEQQLNQVIQGHGRIVGITGEAGMGKSRLVAEIIRLSGQRHLIGYGGECLSYGTKSAYLVWQSIWRSFFGVDPAWELNQQVNVLTRQLRLLDPELVPRLPLLSTALNLRLPDNDLTRAFDAKLRKTSLEGLLVDCLRGRAKMTPTLLVLEDCQWLDPLSQDLLEVLGRAMIDLPVLIVLAYRPQRLRVSQLAHFTEIQLTDFTLQEAEQLIRLKLRLFFGSDTEAPRELIDRLTARAEGNPFYIEELLNYIQDRGIDPHDSSALQQLDLPTSLHSLILSRIDQLAESQKVTLKLASVIGRWFKAAWLWGAYPHSADPERINKDLEILTLLELTQPDAPEPELAYIFKHIVTQEVAYESLPYALRATLHDHLGQFVERTFGQSIEQYIDLLAYHYDRSQNEAKKRIYLQRAGEVAQANYANAAAIDYYQRVLPLLSPEEQTPVTLKLGHVLELVGQWQAAGDLYRQMLEQAGQLGDRQAQAQCQTAIGELFRKQGRFAEAFEWLERARAEFEALADASGVGQVLHYAGSLAAQQGNYATARARYEQSLAIRRKLDEKPHIASLLSNLGVVARYQGNLEAARALHEEGLLIRRELGDRRAIAVSLNNLGNVALDQRDYAEARARLEEAVALQRQVGDKAYIANSLNNLGNVARAQGDSALARALYRESLTINWEIGDRWAIAYLLEDIGSMAALQGRPKQALRLIGAAAALREAIGSPLSPAEQAKLEQLLQPTLHPLDEAAQAAARTEGQALSLEQAIAYALSEC